MKLKYIFSNNYNTSEFEQDKQLKPHYYQNSYEDVKYAVSNFARSNELRVETVDDRYGEILLTSSNIFLTVTLSEYSARLVSVNLTLSTKYTLPFGRGIKFINNLYRFLDSKLILKSIGSSSRD